MKIYAISDIHGYLQEFERALSLINLTGDHMLILLGDYIHFGPDSYGVLDRIMDLQEQYGEEKVTALLGNHEETVIERREKICEHDSGAHGRLDDGQYIKWMKSLPRYYKTQKQIFCHAGMDEEAEDLWEIGTEKHIFTEKFPFQTGSFYMDIIAGHISTSQISGKPDFHDIFFDGESHYCIDGETNVSGFIPVLVTNSDADGYFSLSERGLRRI